MPRFSVQKLDGIDCLHLGARVTASVTAYATDRNVDFFCFDDFATGAAINHAVGGKTRTAGMTTFCQSHSALLILTSNEKQS